MSVYIKVTTPQNVSLNSIRFRSFDFRILKQQALPPTLTLISRVSSLFVHLHPLLPLAIFFVKLLIIAGFGVDCC
ncbi:hypothetical protein P8452_10735 [Trifolium repens]|nr:hypothetical protein P8452_10735 [Trifolium repens]